MSVNNRIFYACQAVSLSGHGVGPSASSIVKGVQSVGITSNFTLDQAFELGQAEIYENIEEVADIEVSLEKVIDGEPLMYKMATATATGTELDIVPASTARCELFLGIYDDSVQSVASTNKRHVVHCSGMYIGSISYTYPVDGSATESMTLVGNDKFWDNDSTAAAGAIPVAPSTSWANGLATGLTGTDTPASGIVRRTGVDIANCTIPADIPNVGDNKGHIQSISVSADFGRENILELGTFGPYYRYATFPFETTCEIETIATQGDQVAVSGAAQNLQARTIIITDSAGTRLDLGTQNKLTSVSYTGGDTGGGNATVTFSYSTFNKLSVNGPGISA